MMTRPNEYINILYTVKYISVHLYLQYTRAYYYYYIHLQRWYTIYCFVNTVTIQNNTVLFREIYGVQVILHYRGARLYEWQIPVYAYNGIFSHWVKILYVRVVAYSVIQSYTVVCVFLCAYMSYCTAVTKGKRFRNV